MKYGIWFTVQWYDQIKSGWCKDKDGNDMTFSTRDGAERQVKILSLDKDDDETEYEVRVYDPSR